MAVFQDYRHARIHLISEKPEHSEIGILRNIEENKKYFQILTNDSLIYRKQTSEVSITASL